MTEQQPISEKDVPLAERSLSVLDRILHWSLDWYITRTLPGWGHLQVWQYRVCCAYEHRYDQRVLPPAECRACRIQACEIEGNTAEPHTCATPPADLEADR